MPNVQIRDVPERTHRVLKQRAAAAGKSLQEYLVETLNEVTAKPTVQEVLDRAGGRAGGRLPLTAATKHIRRDRDRR